MFKLISFLFLLLSTGCQWEQKRPSFLILAFDSLPFESIRCQELDKLKGFKIVCEDMVRFTHAYTPSVLSQSSLSSVLTGKYPFEHGVWNNGSTFLSAKYKTSSEVAIKKGYRTHFISGGAPIWKKSGLDQGFEIFDDHVFVDQSKFYRSSFENIRIFLNWKKELSKNESYFSLIYFPDLQFKEITTVDNEGYPREASYEGQIAEIDESLEYLFDNLKKDRSWENTYVIVTGLNGISKDSREKEFSGSNLFHENTRVALFIKPMAKGEHDKSNWKIDGNVNLVDLGRTLYSLLDEEFYETTQTLFKSMDLKESILKAKEVEADRVLLFESGWPQWRKEGRTLFALQKEHYLMLYENPPRMYNTLIDSTQNYPIDHQQSFQILTDSANELLNLLNLEESSKISPVIVEKMQLAHFFFKREGYNSEYLELVKNFYQKTKDLEVAGWLVGYYLQNQNWKAVLDLGYSAQKTDWIWIAKRNLNEESVSPQPCLKVFDNLKSVDLSEYQNICSNQLLVQLVIWTQTKNQKDFLAARDTFFKNFKIFKTDYDIQKMNFQNGYIWDTAKDKVSEPNPVEIALMHPNMARYKSITHSQF